MILSKHRGVVLGLVVMLVPSGCVEGKPRAESASREGQIRPNDQVTITIVYDNNEYDARLTPAWGFSCVVKARGRTILFDTGGDGEILLDNMKKLCIDTSEIDAVVLSHIHGDHTWGLKKFLDQNNEVVVYLPRSFPTQMKRDVVSSGAGVKDLHEPVELSQGVFSTGELDGGIREQSLLLESSEGLIVITGCAHPGIVYITKKAIEITANNVYLVVGGFHLGGSLPSQISSVAESLLRLGVQKVAPCHCSGDAARKMFKDYFGENYIQSGLGRRTVIT